MHRPRPRNLLAFAWLLIGSAAVAQPAPDPVDTADAERRLEALAERYLEQNGTLAEASAPASIEDRPLGTASTEPLGLPTGGDAGPGGGWALSTLAALGVVIALIFALRFALGKFGGNLSARPSPAVQVLARTTVAPKNHVLLLRVGPRVLVVGDSSAGLRTLSEVTDPEEVAALMQSVTAAQDASLSRGFQNLVQKFNADYDGRTRAEQEGGDEGEVHVDRTRDTLSGLAGRIRVLGNGGKTA